MEDKGVSGDAEQLYHRMVETAERLYPLFAEEERQTVRQAIELLRRRIIPLLRHECPLLVAVTGGGSVGKSTLFNMLAGGAFSGVKSRAGYTRRTLAALPPSVAESQETMALLFELFKKNALPVPLSSPDEMLEPGAPLFVVSERISSRLAVLDTPDFDTGSSSEYANREAAEEILAASDVLVYLFTNQTYNNKANTDFVRRAASGIGRRKVALVYRCSSAYSEDEVCEHIDEVLRNLFPDSAKARAEALGFYRVDESDKVVRGEAAPVLRPLLGSPEFMELLNGLDIVEARRDNLRQQCRDVVKVMNDALGVASVRRSELVAYMDSVKALASHALLEGLKNFPQRLLLEQFAECWRAAQPGFVRAAHWSGRMVSSAIGRLREMLRRNEASGAPERGGGQGQACAAEEYEAAFRDDFRDCVGKLRAKLSQPVLGLDVAANEAGTAALRTAVKELALQHREGYGYAVHGKGRVECSVARPVALKRELEAEIRRVAGSDDDGWIERAVGIACLNDDIMKDIAVLVDEARRNMTFWEKSKENLWATAATLPAIGAVAWVVCTSDPVAGPGAIAHLGAIFGLGDFYAVLSIPAAWGLDAAHKAFLESRLQSLYRTWFERKRGPISQLIEENVTSRCIRLCGDLLQATAAPFERLREAVGLVAPCMTGKETNA